MEPLTLGLALLAGVLSILSPCVLPLLPIVLGASASEHRFGPLVLAAGLATSFTVIGLFVATVGFAIGLDDRAFRTVGGLVMVALGAVLLVPAAQLRLAMAAAPLQGFADRTFGRTVGPGLTGQAALGLLLGLVWSPCVGPTLGAASVMAARGENLPAVAATMLAFGLGAGLPLALLGLATRGTLAAWRARLAKAGGAGKTVLGLVLVTLGVMVLAGWDKQVEAALVAWSPGWLTALTTRF